MEPGIWRINRQAYCCWAERLYISLPDNMQQRQFHSSLAPSFTKARRAPQRVSCVCGSSLPSTLNLLHADIPGCDGQSSA